MTQTQTTQTQTQNGPTMTRTDFLSPLPTSDTFPALSPEDMTERSAFLAAVALKRAKRNAARAKLEADTSPATFAPDASLAPWQTVTTFTGDADPAEAWLSARTVPATMSPTSVLPADDGPVMARARTIDRKTGRAPATWERHAAASLADAATSPRGLARSMGLPSHVVATLADMSPAEARSALARMVDALPADDRKRSRSLPTWSTDWADVGRFQSVAGFGTSPDTARETVSDVSTWANVPHGRPVVLPLPLDGPGTVAMSTMHPMTLEAWGKRAGTLPLTSPVRVAVAPYVMASGSVAPRMGSGRVIDRETGKTVRRADMVPTDGTTVDGSPARTSYDPSAMVTVPRVTPHGERETARLARVLRGETDYVVMGETVRGEAVAPTDRVSFRTDGTLRKGSPRKHGAGARGGRRGKR